MAHAGDGRPSRPVEPCAAPSVPMSHVRIVPSRPAEASHVPSCSIATSATFGCSMTMLQVPVWDPRRRTEPFWLAEATGYRRVSPPGGRRSIGDRSGRAARARPRLPEPDHRILANPLRTAPAGGGQPGTVRRREQPTYRGLGILVTWSVGPSTQARPLRERPTRRAPGHSLGDGPPAVHPGS